MNTQKQNLDQRHLKGLKSNWLFRRNTNETITTSQPQLPRPLVRHHNSMDNTGTSMDQTQKKNGRPSNLSNLLSGFEHLKQNIRNMQDSNTRIVDKIQKSYDGSKFTQGIYSVKTERVSNYHQNSISPNTNYRYEVEEVHQVEGIDEAYEIRRLESIAKDLKRKLEDQIKNANYYKFQVWMLNDVLKRNGVRVSDVNQKINHRHSINGPIQTSLCMPNFNSIANNLQTRLGNFAKNVVEVGMEDIDNYCKQQLDKLDLLINKVNLQLTLKCSYLKNKIKFGSQHTGNWRKKIESYEKQLGQKNAEIKNLEGSYQAKNNELLGFREQVGNFVDKIRGQYTQKISELDQALKTTEEKNRDLQQRLKLKSLDSPKKRDQLMRSRCEVDRLSRLLQQLNQQLELKDQRLVEREAQISRLESDLQVLERTKLTTEKDLETLRQRHQELCEEKKQLEHSVRLEWLPFQNSMIDNLEKSNILPNVTETSMQTDIKITEQFQDKLIIELREKIGDLEKEQRLFKWSKEQMQTICKKLKLAEEINIKLQQELYRLKGQADRKMYKSVLGVESKIIGSDIKDSRLESRIPKSKRYTSILREEDQPNRKLTGNSETSVLNTFSKLSGYKELSLNLSVDDDTSPVAFNLDLQQLITQPDYPFQRLKLSSSDTVFVIMKLAQIIRCQRDQIKQKKRQVNLMKSRNDPSKQLISQLSSGIEQEDKIQLSDYNQNYSEKVFLCLNQNGLDNRAKKKRIQWQQLQRQSMQAIERLLEQVEGLQAELQKAERNENNLIQMKELYKAEISKLNKMTEEYQIYYKEEVRRLTVMLKEYEQNRNIQAIKQLIAEVVRICRTNKQICDQISLEQLNSEQFNDYIRMLNELLHID